LTEFFLGNTDLNAGILDWYVRAQAGSVPVQPLAGNAVVF
jgi:hypothetical protein